tara:strand:+ start:871 stop:1701 length:831 start_codon:yes stop_codon:yes gene_type:complete
MDNKKISGKILEKIKEDKLTPIDRRIFVAKNYGMWALAGISLLIGSIAVSVMIFTTSNRDWDIYTHVSDSRLEYIVEVIPYLWIVILILFVFVADYNLRKTNKGYRFRLLQLVLTTIGISLALGTLLYLFGAGHALDTALHGKIPFHKGAIHRQEIFWDRAEDGFLAGTITEFTEGRNFTLEDFEKQIWLINGEKLPPPMMGMMTRGDKVRIVGKKLPDFVFEACMIRPWNVRGRGFLSKPPPNERKEFDVRSNNCERDAFPIIKKINSKNEKIKL